jgi:hypothetical protein
MGRRMVLLHRGEDERGEPRAGHRSAARVLIKTYLEEEEDTVGAAEDFVYVFPLVEHVTSTYQLFTQVRERERGGEMILL